MENKIFPSIRVCACLSLSLYVYIKRKLRDSDAHEESEDEMNKNSSYEQIVRGSYHSKIFSVSSYLLELSVIAFSKMNPPLYINWSGLSGDKGSNTASWRNNLQ